MKEKRKGPLGGGTGGLEKHSVAKERRPRLQLHIFRILIMGNVGVTKNKVKRRNREQKPTRGARKGRGGGGSVVS